MLENPKIVLALLGIFVSATVTLAALFIREYLLRRRERWQRCEAYQPLINKITITLGEISERTHALHERQWECPFDELPVSEEDVEWFETRFDQTAEISKDAASSLNDLVRIMRTAIREFERRESIIESRTLELMDLVLIPPSPDDKSYHEYMSLYMNQEYHFWSEHLYKIDDGIWRFAKALYSFASRKDTRRDLASMGLLRPTGIRKLLGRQPSPRSV